MGAKSGFRYAGRTSTEQQDGRVFGVYRDIRRTHIGIALQQLDHAVIAGLELDAVAFFLFFQQREQQAQWQRQMIFDVRRDDAFQPAFFLQRLDLLVERRQYNHRLRLDIP